MADELDFKLHMVDSALLEPKRESGVPKLVSDAYQWISENKTALAIGAAALTVAGGANLLRRAMASGSESAAVDLAIANTEKTGLSKIAPQNNISGKLDFKDPYLTFIDEFKTTKITPLKEEDLAKFLEKLDLEPGAPRAMASGSESAAADLAIADTEKAGPFIDRFPAVDKAGLSKTEVNDDPLGRRFKGLRKLDSKTPYVVFTDEFETALERRAAQKKPDVANLGKLDFRDAPQANTTLGARFIRENQQQIFDHVWRGQPNSLLSMALAPETAPIFRQAAALMARNGDKDWAAALIKTFEEQRPKDLPSIKAGLKQAGMLSKDGAFEGRAPGSINSGSGSEALSKDPKIAEILERYQIPVSKPEIAETLAKLPAPLIKKVEKVDIK